MADMIAWLDANGGIEKGPVEKTNSGIFKANLDAALIANIEDMQAHVSKQDKQIIDARNNSRFMGESAEPRAGLKSGHLPGSFNLPHSNLHSR